VAWNVHERLPRRSSGSAGKTNDAAIESTVHARPVHAGMEFEMPLMSVLVTLIVVGIVLWLINTYIPMDGKIKQILNIVAVIAVVIWLLRVFGVWGNLGNIQVGRG
jgi:hypothetical protein